MEQIFKPSGTKTLHNPSDNGLGFKWSSFIPAAITNSMGASILGGSVWAVPGAIVGGFVGILTTICSELRSEIN